MHGMKIHRLFSLFSSPTLLFPLVRFLGSMCLRTGSLVIRLTSSVSGSEAMEVVNMEVVIMEVVKTEAVSRHDAVPEQAIFTSHIGPHREPSRQKPKQVF